MAVEPLVLLTRQEIIQLLENITFVAHTIAPEKSRFWKSNLHGACSHPVADFTGPLGSILVFDYDFTSCITRLLRIRLHQPADVFVLSSEITLFLRGIYAKCQTFARQRTGHPRRCYMT